MWGNNSSRNFIKIDVVGIAILTLVPIVFGIYAVLIGQDTNWDLRNYHLYNPYAFLNNRSNIDLAPAGLQSYFNPLLDTAYFYAIQNLSPRVVAFLIGLIQGLNFVLVYGIANIMLEGIRWKKPISLFLAIAGLLSVGFLSEVGTILGDSITSLFVIFSLWIVLSSVVAISEHNKHQVAQWIASAGAIVGFGCGLKLTIAIYALALCGALWTLPVSWQNRLRLSLIFGIFVLIAFFITDGYWLYMTWSQYGNPLFPQYNNIFHGALAQPLPMRDVRFLPKSIIDWLFYPIIFTLNPLRVNELGYKQIGWVFAYVSLIGLFVEMLITKIRGRKHFSVSNAAGYYFLAFFFIGYLLWLKMFGIYRYLITLELLVPLLIFVAVIRLLRFRHANYVAVLLIALITAFGFRGIPDYGHSNWAETVYRTESGTLRAPEPPAAVFLVGQPLAWIIPSLDLDVPFIQLAPNFVVSDAYWQHAKSLFAHRTGKLYIVFESEQWQKREERTQAGLKQLSLKVNYNSCDWFVAYIGTSKRKYKYCAVANVETKK